MSVRPPDSIVHRRSNNGNVHPVVFGEKRVSFHEDVVDPGNGNLIQIRIGECDDERGAPEGQEDPQPSETSSSKCSVLKSNKPSKFPSLYVDCRNSDPGSHHEIVLDKIESEMEKNDRNNVWDKHLNVESNQFVNVIKRDLMLKYKESIYKVSTTNISIEFFSFSGA